MRHRSRPRALQTAGALTLLLLATACSDPEPEAPPTPPDITLNVAGDVHFAGTSAKALEPGGLDAVAGVLGDADVTVVNVETAITDRGTPAGKKYTFRAPPSGLRALKAAGVDVAGVANNHGLDYGRVGLTDTLAAGKAEGLPLIGIGTDAAAAFRPWTTTVRGHRLAVFDATQVLDTSLARAWTATDDQPGLASVQDAAGRDRLVAAVKAARGGADSVVVLLHWGKELDECPLPAQQELADALVAAGADAVVGSHAHRQLGQGWLSAGERRAFVDYGLGNFVFYARGTGATTQSGVLHLTLAGRGGVSAAQWRPAQIRSGLPVPLEGAAADAAVQAKAALRPCTDLSGTP
ncbi:CapA family protein [Kineococcus rubinsiae]|uniref:CapA family protein n=1 Tax=Kineococcus rubinsiae TaxID=2609562 RepID=UPI00143053B5|nr:CapA family protein [Kineococcus rubinsiae]NIZ91892.1 CapA family protein [Kineococcus rubinsiae]